MKPVQWWTTQPIQKTGRGPLKRILTGIWPFPQLPGRCSGLPRKARPRRGEAVTSPAPSTHLPHGLRLGAPGLGDEVSVTENKVNALIKAAGANVEPFWPGLFAKALANVNFGSLHCSVGVGGDLPQQEVLPPPPLLPG